ncbi:MAG: TIGR00282 family metallophosphoesterase [Deltaproteobacteria bacterium]|nr:TIGR00282 family metallophosphoesterase [Deltaproteobacteria bacterium]
MVMSKILFLADVVGNPGRRSVKTELPKLITEHSPDIVIINAENAAGGVGTDPSTASELLAGGGDVLTGGNHTWNRKEFWPYLEERKNVVLRPANFPDGAPGSGSTIFETRTGKRIGVINLIARVFMTDSVESPFHCADQLLRDWENEKLDAIFVDFHGEATSEKRAMAEYLDGRISALVGTHTHVQTADEQLLPRGTAFLSDAGMCGPVDSVIGMRVDAVVQRFVSGLPIRFDVAKGQGMVNGCVIVVDDATRRATSIVRINRKDEPEAQP